MIVWVVRAGGEAGEEQIALDRNVAVIGWSELPDLTSVQSRDELRDLYEHTFPDAAPGTVTQHITQIWAFRSEVKEGDLVVLPLESEPDSLAIGRVASPYRYRPDILGNAHHTHAVDWLNRGVPRSAFKDDLNASFNVPSTVSRVGAEDAEERITAVLQGEPDVGPMEREGTAEFDRQSEHTARSVVEKLYPDPAVRLEVLRILAASIGHAHSVGPRAWQLTLHHANFRLIVGQARILDGLMEKLFLVVDGRALDPALQEQIAAIGTIEPDSLKSLKSPLAVTITGAQLQGMTGRPFFPALQEAHFRAIDEARAKFSAAPFARAHSPGLLKYMRAQLGEDIPDPEYSVPAASPVQRNVWLFQANPDKYDLDARLRNVKPGDADEWYVSRYGDEMRPGHIVLIWQGGTKAGLYAIGELTSAVYQRPVSAWWAGEAEPFALEPGISFRYTHILPTPIPRSTLVQSAELDHLQVIQQPQESNFKVTQEEWRAIQALIEPAGPPPKERYAEPSFDAILKSIQSKGLRIDDSTLRRYHISLKVRGFVILSGISGTGKTWLGTAYADAVGAECLVVAVAPNWTTNEDLLGYWSPLDKEYHDTDFSRFIRAASAEYARALLENRLPQPFHLVLDEMNLARVEYYFAKFLSAMEERAREGVARIELAEGDSVLLPPNLFFVGTVNVDETTHGFADKVYDRAQLIELSAPHEALLLHIGDRPWRDLLMEIWDAVHEVAPFAFRIADEIAAYVGHAESLGGSWKDALDEQILQKVLPKLSRTDARMGSVLQSCIQIAEENELPLTLEKAKAMSERLQEYGFASYF
jgi:hypothetical protein